MYSVKKTRQAFRAVLIAAGAIFLLTPSALNAQSFNLDLGTTFSGLPTTFAGAAGQTGTWVDLPTGTTNSLTDVAGTPTGVTVAINGSADAFNPETTLGSRLLRDSIGVDSFLGVDLEINFSGLQDGNYTAYYYSGPSGIRSLTINGAAASDLPGIGSADAIGAQGTNWNRANVTVVGGTLSFFSDTTSSADRLSGIQLVYQAQTTEAKAVPTLPSWALIGTMLAVLLLGLYLLRPRYMS